MTGAQVKWVFLSFVNILSLSYYGYYTKPFSTNVYVYNKKEIIQSF